MRHILTIGNGRGPDEMGGGIPIAEAENWVSTSVGVHPHEAAKVEERHFAEMEALAKHPKVVAIGETGLDYYYDHSARDVQQEVFRRQIRIAKKLDLPVIVHTRDADADTERILTEEAPTRGVLHCFTSSPRLAEFAQQIGFHVSFSGIVTFPKATELNAIARSVAADRLLVETDCPYLSPVPHRGKRNEPSFVVETARFLASVRGVPESVIAGTTTANFKRLFAIAG